MAFFSALLGPSQARFQPCDVTLGREARVDLCWSLCFIMACF
jgi:hypothetical protein